MAGSIPLCQKSPRGSQLLPAAAALRLALAAPVRVIHGISHHAPAHRALAAMPRPARLAEDHVLVLRVSDLPDRGITVLMHAADFTRRKSNLRVALVPRHERGRGARSANHL